VNNNRLDSAKTKKPTIKNSKEETVEEWKNSYDKTFGRSRDNLPKSDIDGFVEPEEEIQVLVTDEMVLKALTRCKMNSAPGPSSISY